MSNIEIGDRVHCRLHNHENGSTAIQEFVVSSIDGTVYGGGALPCDTSLGWSVELVEKSAENLNLPTKISEITVTNPLGISYHLVGKGDNWMTVSGENYPIRQIAQWVPGHV